MFSNDANDWFMDADQLSSFPSLSDFGKIY
jgi:hypothetical protein